MKNIKYFGSPDNTELWTKLYSYIEKEHSCIICGCNSFEIWAKMNYLEAKICKKCGMISTNPHFNDKGVELFYSEYFKHRQENKVKNAQRDITYLIDRDWVSLFINKGKVLDVGCSGGFFLNKFSEKNWERQGVEISSDVSEYALKNFGIPVQVGNIVDIIFTEQFDLIMMRGVIEHFRDPIAALNKCCQLLKKGGFLFITATPAGDCFAFDVYREKWHLFTPLEHIHFFTVKLLTGVLEKFGMKYISHHYQYEETPYANPSKDFIKIQNDIVTIKSGKKNVIETSTSFPGSMITSLWQKK